MTNTSILEGPAGREIDPQVAFAQVGTVVLMRVGAHDRMYGRDYIKFRIQCPPCQKFWCIVKLDADDIYSIEFGRVRGVDWKVAKQADGVYADVLGEVIERMYQEVYL